MWKRINKMVNKCIVIGLTIIIVGLLMSIYSGPSNDNEVGEVKVGGELKAISEHWACMDGCYNMLQIIYGDVEYNNETQKDLHAECSDVCFNKYYLGVINE